MGSHKTLGSDDKDTGMCSGFTLIEILVVMGLMSCFATLALLMGVDSYRSYSFRADRDALATYLLRARAQAVNNVCLEDQGYPCKSGQAHGVLIDTDNAQYVLFQGTSSLFRNKNLDEYAPADSSIVRTGISEVVFTQLSGEATPTGDIMLRSSNGMISTTSVNSAGRIN